MHDGVHLRADADGLHYSYALTFQQVSRDDHLAYVALVIALSAVLFGCREIVEQQALPPCKRVPLTRIFIGRPEFARVKMTYFSLIF
jgi:hypothetical protein